MRLAMYSHKTAEAPPAGPVEADYRLGPDVVLIPVEDGSARLLDFAGETFALSEVAARMLTEALNSGRAKAVETITRLWDVESERVAADLDGLLASLIKEELIVPADKTCPRIGWAESLAGRVVSALVRLTCLVRRSTAGQASGLLTVARFSCRWLGWAKTVRAWQHSFPLLDEPLQGSAAEVSRQTVDAAVRSALAHSTMYHACKERGLTAWALARRAGLSPTLVIGISLFPMHAHCWAQMGGTFLGDSPERCLQYRPVRTYA
jgi:transglutaminase superfamily protein